MTTFDGSDMVLLMLTGVTVVIIALRAITRANRIKQEATAEQAWSMGARTQLNGSDREGPSRSNA